MEKKRNNFIANAMSNYVRLHEDGRVERLPLTLVPPSTALTSLVLSKDIIISHEPDVSVRLFLPNNPPPISSKLPVVIYIHGGGFIVESAKSKMYHDYLTTLAAEARVIVVSVEYRLAPESPLPGAYDDSWAAIEWVGSHSDGLGPEEWLNDHADLAKVFFAGESAGGNVAHHMGLRVGERMESGNGSGLGFKLLGLILVQSMFWGNDPLPGEITDPEDRAFFAHSWRLAKPSTIGNDDPWVNPEKDPSIARMGCSRILVCVAENCEMRERDLYYKELLEKSGWKGEIEVMEAKGEYHIFHLFNPTCENAAVMMNRMVEFINRN